MKLSDRRELKVIIKRTRVLEAEVGNANDQNEGGHQNITERINLKINELNFHDTKENQFTIIY